MDREAARSDRGRGRNSEDDSLAALKADLKIASTILEWEMGDIFGHVGVRLPSGEGIACKMFRFAGDEDEDWLVHFDFEGRKIGGSGPAPMEWPIYTEIFKRRPDVQAIAHNHAPTCIALSIADQPIRTVHVQSAKFAGGVPIHPRPIHIKDKKEGNDLADTLGMARAVVIKGHGIVTVGRSIDDACMNSVYLERTAKIQAVAARFGFVEPAPGYAEEIVASGRIMGAKPGAEERRGARGGHSNEWIYYRNLIRRGERWNRGAT
jgi:L-fuculose-phosphate aldolase